MEVNWILEENPKNNKKMKKVPRKKLVDSSKNQQEKPVETKLIFKRRIEELENTLTNYPGFSLDSFPSLQSFKNVSDQTPQDSLHLIEQDLKRLREEIARLKGKINQLKKDNNADVTCGTFPFVVRAVNDVDEEPFPTDFVV
jgi:hypothetical protein